MDEYLRRNLIHAASVGMKANAEFAIYRLSAHSRQPQWLMDLLQGIVERGNRVCPELAAHRNEIRPETVEDQGNG